RSGIPGVERPAPVGVSPGGHPRDGFSDAAIRPDAGGAQVVEPAQYVVVPPRRECEPRPRRPALAVALDLLAGRPATEQLPLEQVLQSARPRIRHRGIRAESP